jgi:hypothetical protein
MGERDGSGLYLEGTTKTDKQYKKGGKKTTYQKLMF